MHGDTTHQVAYPFAVVRTEGGYSAAALDFPAMATAGTEEELHEVLSEQAALYLYEAELLGSDPPMPTTLPELDRRRSVDNVGGTAFLFVEPAPTNHVSLVIERAMREEGVSASELARRLDVDARVVQRLTNPFYFGHSTRTLRAIATALGKHLRVTFDYGHRVW